MTVPCIFDPPPTWFNVYWHKLYNVCLIVLFHTSLCILFFLYRWFISERCMKISQYNCEFVHFFYNFYQVLLYLSWSSMVRKLKVLSSWWVTPFTPGPAHLLALQLCIHYVTHSITEGFCFYFDKKNLTASAYFPLNALCLSCHPNIHLTLSSEFVCSGLVLSFHYLSLSGYGPSFSTFGNSLRLFLLIKIFPVS